MTSQIYLGCSCLDLDGHTCSRARVKSGEVKSYAVHHLRRGKGRKHRNVPSGRLTRWLVELANYNFRR